MDMHTPMVMSATNPLGLGKRPPSNTRQKTTLNQDLPTDLLAEATGLKSAANRGSKVGLGSKPRLPMPQKRGNSLGPGRMKTSSAADLTGIKAHLAAKGRDTPTGASTGLSTDFSKRSSKTGMNQTAQVLGGDMARPQTEFLPSASQEFGDKVKQGRLRPTRQQSKSGQNQRDKSKKKFKNVATHYIEQDEQKQKAILQKKKRELADLDADLEDFMNVAADGNFNLKVMNDAFEGRAHENEEIDLVELANGEKQIKKR